MLRLLRLSFGGWGICSLLFEIVYRMHVLLKQNHNVTLREVVGYMVDGRGDFSSYRSGSFSHLLCFPPDRRMVMVTCLVVV